MERPRSLAAALTPTSYLVLGLLAREGPSTPYELKRHVAATIGHFWSFPHALLYKEPARLAGLGLLTEERELDGRRRRLFTITPAGREALRAWLSHPARQPDRAARPGPPPAVLRRSRIDGRPLAIAEEQLALHQRQLAGYEADQRFESGPDGRTGISRTVQHWRGVTLRIGFLYERAAVEFWGEVAAGVRSGDDVISRSALPGIAPGA